MEVAHSDFSIISGNIITGQTNPYIDRNATAIYIETSMSIVVTRNQLGSMTGGAPSGGRAGSVIGIYIGYVVFVFDVTSYCL